MATGTPSKGKHRPHADKCVSFIPLVSISRRLYKDAQSYMPHVGCSLSLRDGIDRAKCPWVSSVQRWPFLSRCLWERGCGLTGWGGGQALLPSRGSVVHLPQARLRPTPGRTQGRIQASKHIPEPQSGSSLQKALSVVGGGRYLGLGSHYGGGGRSQCSQRWGEPSLCLFGSEVSIGTMGLNTCTGWG